MRIYYSKEADAIYINLKEEPVNNTDEITDGIILDFDEK